MTQLESLLQQALALPRPDRARVVDALQQSLVDDGDSRDSESIQELMRRSKAYREGTTTSRPAEDVLADLRKRQSSDSKS